MPVLDGPGTAMKIAQKYPLIKMVVLSMKDDEMTVIRMLKAGCCAYLLKDIHPDELERALHEISAKGYFNGDFFNINYRRLILKADESEALEINDREMEFVKLACSDLTYKQIASQMHFSERTIDGYRESLFQKFNLKKPGRDGPGGDQTQPRSYLNLDNTLTQGFSRFLQFIKSKGGRRSYTFPILPFPGFPETDFQSIMVA